MAEILGRYELLHRLGAGGMGEVYLARQRGPVGFEKFVAIKTLLPHLTEDEEFVNMFFDEARIAALLSHQNIAQIFDLGETNGRYYIAMEYVHGQTVPAIVSAANRAQRALTLGQICRIVAGAAQALDHAHDACNPAGQSLGLIHRDVTPSNIMIAFSGVVKLLDFGVAKANNKLVRTATGVIKGKYPYMSPEQARGDTLDRRSDVFALGIVFHELLTHRRLFQRENIRQTLEAVAGAKIPAPSELVPTVPRALDAIVMKALARNRDDRYATCGQFYGDIEGVIQRQRLPATAGHIGALMRELYPAESAPDAMLKLSQTVTAPLDQTPFDDDRRTIANRLVGEGALDPAELEDRLSTCGPRDRCYGLFLNGIESAVLKNAGARPGGQLRQLAAAPKEWVDSLCYPTGELLRLLWGGVGILAPRCSGVDPAFDVIGQHIFAALLASPLGAPLRQLAEKPPPPIFLRPLIQLLSPMIEPGARLLADCSDHAALLVFKGEVLPLQLYASILSAAFERFGSKTLELLWEKTMPERVELEVRW